MPLLIDLTDDSEVIKLGYELDTLLSKKNSCRLIDIIDGRSIGDYFILSRWPEKQIQIGPTCGIVATTIASRYASDKGKTLPAYKQGSKETKSVRQIAKESDITDFGGIFRTDSLETLGKQLGYASVNVLPMDNPSEAYYVNTLCKELSSYHTVIAAVDIDNTTGQPGYFNGNYPHWALVFGYLVLDNECYFLITHANAYQLWSAHDLFESNKQLPMKISHYAESSYYKYTMDSKKVKDILKQTERPSNVLKEIPFAKEQSLEQFRFGLCSWPVEILPDPTLSVHYKRENENPELAKICADYQVEETLFNQYLSLKGPYPDEAVPNFSINGSEIGYPGYCFLKFPKKHPKVHVLREMIGYDFLSETFLDSSIINALTSDNSGFYVLLKAKKAYTQGIHPVDEQSQTINLHDYSVVGLTEAWITASSNLALFFKNAWSKRDEPVLIAFAKKFTDILFADQHNADKFSRVLSCSRNENEIVDAFTPFDTLGIIKVGSNFQQPKYQALVGVNPEKTKVIGFDSIVQKEWFDSLFQKEAYHYKQIFNEGYDELCKTARSSAFLAEAYFLLHQANALNPKIVALIKSIDPKKAKDLLSGLSYLLTKDPTFLVTPLFENVIQSDFSLSTIKGMYQLIKLEPELVTEEHTHDLFTLFKYDGDSCVHSISQQFSRLAELVPDLIEGQNLELFKKAPLANIAFLADVLCSLFEANPSLVNDENKQSLLTLTTREASDLGYLWFAIKKSDVPLIDQDSFRLLITHVRNALPIKDVLYSFGIENITLDLFKRLVSCIDEKNQELFVNFFNHDPNKTEEGCTYLLNSYYSNDALITDELIHHSSLKGSYPLKNLPSLFKEKDKEIEKPDSIAQKKTPNTQPPKQG